MDNKELFLADLCARLPYGVKIRIEYPFSKEEEWHPEILYGLDLQRFCIANTSIRLEEFKPYLYPLSSMTEEQYDEMEKIVSEDYLENIQVTKEIREKVDFITHWPLYSPKVIDWFIRNHFDYRGLIEKGLAIDATGLNIY